MFKDKFKYFKSKSNTPDFNEVIGFTPLDTDSRVIKVPVSSNICDNVTNPSVLGLVEPSQWNVYLLAGSPGLWFLLNPFTSSGQREWSRRALVEYTKPPNRLNLHAHGDIKEGEDWWDICLRNSKRRDLVYKKLRWATLGYHHDWDNKIYKESNKSEFPEELKQLCSYVGQLVGGWSINAEAAIVNYYHFGSTLSGHTDHSEIDLTAPLLSLSFGQSALFLIGGRTIEDNCNCLLLRSGDIVIMSGESRLSYHGVPLILPTDRTPWLENLPSDQECRDLTHVFNYLRESRINVNIRQVLPTNQKCL